MTIKQSHNFADFFANARIGIIGATSPLAQKIIPRLNQWGATVVAFSRDPHETLDITLRWRTMDELFPPAHRPAIPIWLSFAPTYILTNHLDALSAAKAKKVIMISPATRLLNEKNNGGRDYFVAQALAVAEGRLHAWAESEGVDARVLWPTDMYGHGKMDSITAIERWIEKHDVFPLLGGGAGLRQPVHIDDVIDAIIAAIIAPDLLHRGYVLSGGETLTYRVMIERVFFAMGKEARFFDVPAMLYRAAFGFLSRGDTEGKALFETARSMNLDFVFANDDARRDLGFVPRPLTLAAPESLRQAS